MQKTFDKYFKTKNMLLFFQVVGSLIVDIR